MKECEENWMERGGKKGHMINGWLLTNRKHVGKTMNVSVLNAALKNGRMGGGGREVDR